MCLSDIEAERLGKMISGGMARIMIVRHIIHIRAELNTYANPYFSDLEVTAAFSCTTLRSHFGDYRQ